MTKTYDIITLANTFQKLALKKKTLKTKYFIFFFIFVTIYIFKFKSHKQHLQEIRSFTGLSKTKKMLSIQVFFSQFAYQ